ncbi:hypothetical protein ACQEV4_07600 [Streptomyces shenzhenensis]|uniref:hypothetical protein n=1 Tax=Streptomyces shenzhenensis TaxID=943815 RepID=UPI003D94690B
MAVRVAAAERGGGATGSDAYDLLPADDPGTSAWHDDASREARWTALREAAPPDKP